MQWFCYASAYATTANVQPSFVSTSSYTVLLLRCFLLNITACSAAQLGGRTFERRAPFATSSFKKGGGHIFGRLWYVSSVELLLIHYATIQHGGQLHWRPQKSTKLGGVGTCPGQYSNHNYNHTCIIMQCAYSCLRIQLTDQPISRKEEWKWGHMRKWFCLRFARSMHFSDMSVRHTDATEMNASVILLYEFL